MCWGRGEYVCLGVGGLVGGWLNEGVMIRFVMRSLLEER